MNGLQCFRTKRDRHALHIGEKIKVDTIKRDKKTGVLLKACMHRFQSMGAGKYKGLGLQVLEYQPANKIIAISELPLIQMDLEKYSTEEYIRNAWYTFGSRVCPANDFTMLANARAPLNGEGEVED